MRLVFSSIWSLVLGLLAASCTSSEVRVLKQPRAGSPAAAQAALEGESRAVLERDGLAAHYRSSPVEALRELEGLHQERGGEDRLLALADLCAGLGAEQAGRMPDAAVGCYLDAIRVSRPAALRLADSGTDYKLLLVHNEGCAALAALLKREGRSLPARFEGPLRNYQLSMGRPADGAIDGTTFDELLPADRIEVRHSKLRPRFQFGIGGAMVAHVPKHIKEGAEQDLFASVGYAFPVNAMVRFSPSGSEARLVLRNLLENDEIRAGGRSLPLNADWGSSLGFLYSYTPPSKTGFAGMLQPEKYQASTYLYELAPFDPDKIPVVLTHGLMSTPLTWINMLNELGADPVLRKNYQPVVFRYPTGYPITRNAASMRAKLEGYGDYCRRRGGGSNLRKMVLIGHSMGGILSNVQIRDSGEEIRKLYFERPIDQLGLSPRGSKRFAICSTSNPTRTSAARSSSPHPSAGARSPWVRSVSWARNSSGCQVISSTQDSRWETWRRCLT